MVIGGYLLAITAFGSYFARFQRTTRDYFLTGRSVPWWAICFTIVATETSTLTFISVPATAYNSDMTFLQLVVGYVIGRLVVSALFIPAYFRGDLMTSVRAAAATLRPARQEPLGDHFPADALPRGWRAAVRDRAGHLGRHAGAGHLGGRHHRHGDDRLHRPRRRRGGDLDRRRPAVRLYRRRRRRLLLAAALDSGRVGGGHARRRRGRQVPRPQSAVRRCRSRIRCGPASSAASRSHWPLTAPISFWSSVCWPRDRHARRRGGWC